MKICIKYMLVMLSLLIVIGCTSTTAVGGAEISRGDKGSRVGITNTGDGPEMYGSLRVGSSF